MEKEARPSSQAQAQKDARQIVSLSPQPTLSLLGACVGGIVQLAMEILILTASPGNKLLAPSISAPQVEAHV